MSRGAKFLLAILGVSLVVNAVILVRYSRLNEKIDALEQRRPAATSAAKTQAPDSRIDQLASDVASLRRDVAAMKGGPSTPPPSDPAPVPSGIPMNPKLAEVLSEQDSAAAFWKKLTKLANGAEGMEAQEFRSLAFETTAQYLGVDAATLGQTAQTAMNAMTAHEKAYQEEWRGIWESRDKDRQGFDARSKEFAARMDAARKGIMSQLHGMLSPDSNRSHRRFAGRLEDWLQLVRHPETAEDE